MPDTYQLAYGLLAGALIAIAYKCYKPTASNPLRLPLPPGPKPEPIIGNARHIPLAESWVRFLEWKETYGDVIYLKTLGRTMVVINSYETVKELIDNGARHSDRPRYPMAGELMGYDKFIFTAPFGEMWKAGRKLLHSHMHKNTIPRYWAEQENAAKVYLQTLLDAPEEFHGNLTFFTARMIMSITYGIRIKSLHDKHVVNIEKAITTLAAAGTPGAYYVDILPILKYVPSWFPGAGFKRKAKVWKAEGQTLVEDPFNQVKAEMAAGTAPPSFTSNLLLEGSASDEAIMWTAGSLYGAASETTSATLALFIYAMMTHPDVQKKAQQEIDLVVGPDRLPTFTDREKLPYLECILKESFRWYPSTPMGLPHRSIEDDYLKGYWIPSGSMVIANIWAICRDETKYPNADEFIPERFEGGHGAQVLDPRNFIFGFGRRMCAGQHFADSALFICIASILATFDISKAHDGDGREIEPEMDFDFGITSHLRPFPCSIKPRSSQAASLIQSDQ